MYIMYKHAVFIHLDSMYLYTCSMSYCYSFLSHIYIYITTNLIQHIYNISTNRSYMICNVDWNTCVISSCNRIFSYIIFCCISCHTRNWLLDCMHVVFWHWLDHIQWSILRAEAVEALVCACVMQRTGKANSVAGLSSMLGTTASLAARQ